jgi:hypothetical protein
MCLICSKKGSEKSSGKARERDGDPDTVKGGSVVLSKNVLDDGKRPFIHTVISSFIVYTNKYMYVCCYVRLKRHVRLYMHSTHICSHTFTYVQMHSHVHVLAHVQTQHLTASQIQVWNLRASTGPRSLVMETQRGC